MYEDFFKIIFIYLFIQHLTPSRFNYKFNFRLRKKLF